VSTSTIEVRQVTVRLHHDRLIVYLGSEWVCQLPRAYGIGSHGPRACAPSHGPCCIAAVSATFPRMSTGGTSGSACWPPMTTSSWVPRSAAVEAALPLLLKQLKLTPGLPACGR
jgi:hypothetical protein